MKDSLFRDSDNGNKYVKAPYQVKEAKIGHLEYLYDYLKENYLEDWGASTKGFPKGVVVFDTNGLYRNILAGNTSKPSVNSPSNGWELLSDITPPAYKVYSVLVTQTGTSAPTVKVLENTLGTVTISYDSVGYYYFTSSGLFTEDKTFHILSSGGGNNALQKHVVSVWEDADNISIQCGTIATTVVPANGVLIRASFEIRVYN